jgi:hypothetical protein
MQEFSSAAALGVQPTPMIIPSVDPYTPGATPSAGGPPKSAAEQQQEDWENAKKGFGRAGAELVLQYPPGLPELADKLGVPLPDLVGAVSAPPPTDPRGQEQYEFAKKGSTYLVLALASVVGGLKGAPREAPAIAAEAGGGSVSVFHGSIRNGAEILEKGLDPARAPTFVSRDLAAAQDALLNHPDAVRGLGEIVESRIPASQFSELMAPFERPYGGFYPYGLQSTEIPLRSAEQIHLFNDFIVR